MFLIKQIKKVGIAASLIVSFILVLLLGYIGVAHAKNTLTVVIWTPPALSVFQNMADKFEEAYPDSKVKIEVVPGTEAYDEVLVTKLMAGVKFDVVQLRDPLVPKFARINWLVPIDDFPGAEEYKKDLSPAMLGELSYKGLMYGLPYYSGPTISVFFPEVLEKAGYKQPPSTLNGLKEMCLKVKEANISYMGHKLKYPLLTNTWAKYQDLMANWLDLTYSTSSRKDHAVLDEEGNPVFKEAGTKALQWMHDTIYKWEIVDPNIPAMDIAAANDRFFAGKGAAFLEIGEYLVGMGQNPEYSAVVDKFEPCFLMTGNAAIREHGRPLVICRSYCIPYTSPNKDNAWRLVQYLGGKDKSGEYLAAKEYFRAWALGFAYTSLWEDPEIQKKYQELGLPFKLIQKNRSFGYPMMEVAHFPWYAEWQHYALTKLNGCLTGSISVEKAIDLMIEKVEELKAKF